MYINNEDLEFLIELENKLFFIKKWHPDAEKLYALNERLINQRKAYSQKSYDRIKIKRKINKNYARENNYEKSRYIKNVK